MSAQRSRLARVGRTLADLIWPPRSLLSSARVDRLGTLEPELWQALAFLHGPGCQRCGIPLPEATSPDIICPACLVAPPVYERARAALVYDDLSRPMVLDLKHGGRKDGLPAFANWMAEAAPFAAEADQIVPVPLHWSRLWQRGYNQSAWLAHAFATRVGRRFNPDLVSRKRATPSQNGLSATGRKRNVQGAFVAQAAIKDQSIILVDDVMTTGATLQACTRALLRAGAAHVSCVTLARVVRSAKLDGVTSSPENALEPIDA